MRFQGKSSQIFKYFENSLRLLLSTLLPDNLLSMTNLTSLAPVPGSQKKRVRRARGRASGLGGTAGRGMNGQNSRTGRKRYATFE